MSTLVQVMAWWSSLLTHINVARPQWVKGSNYLFQLLGNKINFQIMSIINYIMTNPTNLDHHWRLDLSSHYSYVTWVTKCPKSLATWLFVLKLVIDNCQLYITSHQWILLIWQRASEVESIHSYHGVPMHSLSSSTESGPCLNIKTVFPGTGIPMLKINGRDTILSLTWGSLYW